MALLSVTSHSVEVTTDRVVKESDPKELNYYQTAIFEHDIAQNHHWIEAIMLSSRLTDHDKEVLISQLV